MHSQEDFVPLLDRLKTGANSYFVKPFIRNSYKRTLCMVRCFLGYSFGVDDMPSEVDDAAEDSAGAGSTSDDVYFDDEELAAANATREAEGDQSD
jgi:hypothetical protein